MDDHGTRSGDTSPKADPAGAQERDLNFLRPLIDKISAVEFKFQGEPTARSLVPAVGAQSAVNLEARLEALERDVAAMRQKLQALSREANTAADPVIATPAELPSNSWLRIALAAATTIVLLLIAHWLVVFVYDLPTPILRVVSVAIPLSIAMVLTLPYRVELAIEVAVAVLIGVVAVFGMSYVTSLYENSSFLPQNLRELREVLEYVSSIAFAHLAGALASSALQARSGARNPAGDATLKLARLLASAPSKAAKTAAELKAQVDLIQGVIRDLLPIASAIAALVAGLKGVLS